MSEVSGTNMSTLVRVAEVRENVLSSRSEINLACFETNPDKCSNPFLAGNAKSEHKPFTQKSAACVCCKRAQISPTKCGYDILNLVMC